MNVSTRMISRSMLAVLGIFCAALILPAVGGVPTGDQGRFIIAQNQANECTGTRLCWDRTPNRQQRIVIARNNRTNQPTVMAQTDGNPAM